MKKIVWMILIGLGLMAVAVFYFLGQKDKLSASQKEIVKLFGYPDQFVITYLPRGEADRPQLVRSETWYYFDNGQEISWLAGDILTTEEYIGATDLPHTTLKPEQFDFFMTFADLADIFGEVNIVPADLPAFYEEGEYAAYVSPEAVFMVENDRLTYLQTVGLSKESADGLFPDEEVKDEAEDEKKPASPGPDELSSWVEYSNQELNLSLKRPPEWYLENNDIVLTSYDPNYLLTGGQLPETRLKCDFVPYNSMAMAILDEEQLLSEPVDIYWGRAEDKSSFDGPGLGDAQAFLIKREKQKTIVLLCYAYSDSFLPDLKKMFTTLKIND